MRHASELITPVPFSEEDPWWWCTACADDDHDNHSATYVDLIDGDAACTCPRCA